VLPDDDEDALDDELALVPVVLLELPMPPVVPQLEPEAAPLVPDEEVAVAVVYDQPDVPEVPVDRCPVLHTSAVGLQTAQVPKRHASPWSQSLVTLQLPSPGGV
jgi:hypothetical protein